MKPAGRPALVVVFGLAAALGGAFPTGCRGRGPRARAEAVALRRQTHELRRLVAAVKREEVFSDRHLAVGIRQELVRDLVQLTLPIETSVPGGVTLRLHTADVAFQGGESVVTLRGLVGRTHDPKTQAELTAFGASMA